MVRRVHRNDEKQKSSTHLLGATLLQPCGCCQASMAKYMTLASYLFICHSFMCSAFPARLFR
jgi:hypothetical protein